MNHYLFNYPKYKMIFNFQMDQPKWSIDPSIDLSKLVDLLDQSVWDFCKFLHKNIITRSKPKSFRDPIITTLLRTWVYVNNN